MQGYIIDIKNVRDDDLIVTIIEQETIYTTYRFYGARHSTINIGYKIDFELQSSLKTTIPRLKEVIQLGFDWILDREKLYCWQRFVKLFYPHLKEVESIDSFYFNLLNNTTHKMIKQNPKRAIIESYVELLDFEGRLHKDYECFLCDLKIEDSISLVRGFLPTHSECSYSKNFQFKNIEELFYDKSLINFEDSEVEYLWDILMQGL